MNYLEQYNLSIEDINEIESKIDENDYMQYTMQQENVSSIIEYLLSIGIKNIKELLINKSHLFYESPEVIRNTIKKELAEHINQDVSYLDIVGI